MQTARAGPEKESAVTKKFVPYGNGPAGRARYKDDMTEKTFSRPSDVFKWMHAELTNRLEEANADPTVDGSMRRQFKIHLDGVREFVKEAEDHWSNIQRLENETRHWNDVIPELKQEVIDLRAALASVVDGIPAHDFPGMFSIDEEEAKRILKLAGL